MPRGRKILENNEMYVKEKEIEDKLDMIKEEGKKPVQKGRKRLETTIEEKAVVEKPIEVVEKPVEVVEKPAEFFDRFEVDKKIENMFREYIEKMPKPVVQQPNIVVEKKKTKKSTPKVLNKNVVIEQSNEDMLRAEYEREIRRKMMNSLFDY